VNPSSQVPALVETSLGLSIDGPEGYCRAADLVREIKAMREAVKATFGEQKRLAHQAHRAIIAAESPFLERLDQAEDELRGGMLSFARARTVEADMKTREARRILLERARAANVRVAAQMIADGHRDRAEDLLGRPVQLAVDPTWPVSIPYIPGVSIRRTWKAQVSDPLALLRWAAKNGRHELFAPVQKELDKLAREHRGQDAPPGLRFMSSSSVAIGKAK